MHGELLGVERLEERPGRWPRDSPSRAPDGWLRTGDLGYLAGGELYLLGRRKDVIIVRGRDLCAHDVEGVAGISPAA